MPRSPHGPIQYDTISYNIGMLIPARGRMYYTWACPDLPAVDSLSVIRKRAAAMRHLAAIIITSCCSTDSERPHRCWHTNLRLRIAVVCSAWTRLNISKHTSGPILSVFFALIVHSELKSVHPGFPVAFIFYAQVRPN